jgi:hypothetical protein
MSDENRARMLAGVRRATYGQALRQAEADLKFAETTGRKVALRRLVRSLQAVMESNEQEGGTDGLDEGNRH